MIRERFGFDCAAFSRIRIVCAMLSTMTSNSSELRRGVPSGLGSTRRTLVIVKLSLPGILPVYQFQ